MPSDRERPNFFSGPYIDRRAEARESGEWLEQALSDPATRFVVSAGTTHLVIDGPEPRVAFLDAAHPLVAQVDERRLVLLGWFRGTRCVLLEIDSTGPDVLPEGARFEELRPLASRLAADEAALLAYARGMSIWRARHRHCGVCGSPTVPRRAGHVLHCTVCGAEFFPRIDPAIIVLVTDGERALLGRQAEWPAGRYSTIAGFVEPGESLEDAVAREVLEETGVQVDHVRYHSSQPWPFPSSLMLGFEARADADAKIRLSGELEDARWFTREEIASGIPLLPFRVSISYRLIEDWFDAGSDVPLAALRRRDA